MSVCAEDIERTGNAVGHGVIVQAFLDVIPAVRTPVFSALSKTEEETMLCLTTRS
jgi:hypothetical protein